MKKLSVHSNHTPAAAIIAVRALARKLRRPSLFLAPLALMLLAMPRQASATVTFTGAPDATAISAGQPMGVTFSFAGAPVFAQTINISLPAGNGVDWSIDANTVPKCSLTGSVGAQMLTCSFIVVGTSGTTHITSPTVFASCGTYSFTNTPSITVECPSLGLLKTADGTPVSAGDTIAFALLVTNSIAAGTGTAFSVTLSDPLPQGSGVTWTIDNDPAHACLIGTNPALINFNRLDCSFGDLAAGGSASVHITSSTAFASCGTYPNTATLSANFGVPSFPQSASIAVQCPTLQVVKTADNGTLSANDNLGFMLTVSNGGPGTARNVTLSDTLPTNPGLVWKVSGSPACSIGAGALSCSFGDMASGASFTLHLTSPTTAATCGTVNNTATASSTNSPDSVSPAAVTVNCPGLVVSKTPDAASVSANDSVGFTIAVSNTGAGNAYGVAVNDPLPATPGVAWSLSPAVAGCSIGGGTLTCTVGTLAPGASQSIHVTSFTDDASCGTVPNMATVKATNAATVSASGTTTVLCPRLQLMKIPNGGTVNAGDAVGFMLTVTNNGLGTAKGVTLSDALPGNTGLNWAVDAASNLVNCTMGGNASEQLLTCTLADLAPAASVNVHVISLTSSATCGTVNNAASVTAANAPPAGSSASVVVNCPNIAVSKTPAATPIVAGQTATFNIVVNNLGAGVARSVTLTDELPPGISWTDDNTSCPIASGYMNCAFGDVAPADSRTVHVSGVTAEANCGTVTNTANGAATNEPVSAQGDDTSTGTLNVLCEADLSLSKSASPSPVKNGAILTYTMVVKNLGPDHAFGVVLNDPIPAGSVFSAVTPSGSCSAPAVGAGGTVSCKLGNLSPGASSTVTLKVKLAARGRTSVTNIASVSSSTIDPNPPNNSASVTTPIYGSSK